MEIVNKEHGIMKSSLIKRYNQHMGGVDRVDQQLHNLKILQKSYKWYKKLAFCIISQVALNACKVYNFHTGKYVTFLDYLHDCIELLITFNAIVDNDVPVREVFTRLSGRHFPAQKKPGDNATSTRPTKVCKVCYARGIRLPKGGKVRTVWICPSCPSQPGLHPEKCFAAYHT